MKISYTKKIMAIIPARSGSKGIPDKNIKDLAGYPLIAWSIAIAKHCHYFDRVILSTDSEKYAKIGKSFGVECPFLRPSEFANDNSDDRDFLLHAIDWLFENEGYNPEYIALLRPTTPLRDIETLEKATAFFLSSSAGSLCTGFEVPESPVKNFRLEKDGTFVGFMGNEWLSKPRQQCPKAYIWDGVLDILRSENIRYNKNIYGDKRLAYITKPNVEIDTMEEWDYVEYLISKGYGKNVQILLQKGDKVCIK